MILEADYTMCVGIELNRFLINSLERELTKIIYFEVMCEARYTTID